MNSTFMKIEPKLQAFGCPVWWHHHGTKMDIVSSSSPLDEEEGLTITGSAASLKITKHYVLPDLWKAEWEIIFSKNEKVKGIIFWDTEILQKAFGLKDGVDQFGESLIMNFGGDSASQGKFIRYQDFLNLPGPGTGHDDDPNLSIKITKEMKEVIKRLTEPGIESY